MWNSCNHIGVEQVETSVDSVTDEDSGLFNKAFDLTAFLGNHNTVLARVFDFSNDDSALLSVAFVELNEFVERVLANDVRVEHEE